MRVRILVGALCCAAAFFPSVARAEPSAAAPMTLVDAVSYALDHNPTVAQQFASARSAEHSLAQARGTAYPTVNASLQNYMQKSANYGGVYEIIGLQQSSVFSQNTAQVGTNYTLDTGGQSLLQLVAARAQAEQAEETLANTENQVATNVTNAFYSVVQKQAIVVVDASDLSYQNVLVEAAKAKERSGTAAGVDVLKAQVAQTRSASTLVGARADVDDAREALAQTVGTSLDQQFDFPNEIAQPRLPTDQVDTLENIALNARPDVKAADDAVTAALYTRKSWDRELFPQVQIGASMGNQFAPTEAGAVIGINPNGTPIVIPRGMPGFWSLTATSTFTLPLVDYGQRHAERVNDDAQLTSARVALDQARTQVQIDVRQSYRAAQTALAQLTLARDESRLGTESARIAQLQYQHGLIALSDVIQTQQQSVSAQSDFVAARVSYVDAIVKLRVSLGTYTAQSAVADLQ